MMDTGISVLLICTANICRSPMAAAVLSHHTAAAGLSDYIEIDSAGTHAGSRPLAPDNRVIKVLLDHEIDTGTMGRSRPVTVDDFEKYDHILAMDRENYNALIELCPPVYRDKISLIMRYAKKQTLDEVPDPYFGNLSGFERVHQLLDEAIQGFLDSMPE